MSSREGEAQARGATAHRLSGQPWTAAWPGWLACAGLLGLLAGRPQAASSPPPSPWKPALAEGKLEGWEAKPPLGRVSPEGAWTVQAGPGQDLPALCYQGGPVGALLHRERLENFHLRLEYQLKPHSGSRGRNSGISAQVSVSGASSQATPEGTAFTFELDGAGRAQWRASGALLADVEGQWTGRGNRPRFAYQAGGKAHTVQAGEAVIATARTQRPRNAWNQLEVLAWAGNCLLRHNGEVVLALTNLRCREPMALRPALEGMLELRAAGAEVRVRELELRTLWEPPPELKERMVFKVTEAGFLPLFSTEALKDWRQCGPGRFVIESGVATGQGGMGLWWYAARAFTNFVLRGEFLQEQPIADSGVFVRFPDPGADPWRAVRAGHEVEIGDPEPEDPTWRTGSIYPFQAATAAHAQPLGQWNAYEVVGVGHNYWVRLNDRLATAWTDWTRRSLQGYVGLQNYPDHKTVRHRRLRIRELP